MLSVLFVVHLRLGMAQVQVVPVLDVFNMLGVFTMVDFRLSVAKV